MAYRVHELRQTESLSNVIEEVNRELNAISAAFEATTKISVLNAEPTKPRVGMLVYADGTNWDPGSGAGVYSFDGSAWNKL